MSITPNPVRDTTRSPPRGPLEQPFESGGQFITAQMLNGNDGLAIDFLTGQAQIKDSGTPANDVEGNWWDIMTTTGTLAEEAAPSGLTMTTANYLTRSTTGMPYSNTEGTFVCVVNADDTDTNGGSNTQRNAIMGFNGSVTTPPAANHYLNLAKSDNSTRIHRLAVNSFDEATTTGFTELEDNTVPTASLEAVGLSWNDAERVLASDIGSTSNADTNSWVRPDDFLTLYIGCGFSLSEVIWAKAMYLPVKLTEAELAAEVARIGDL